MMRLIRTTAEGLLWAGVFLLLFLLLFETRIVLPAWVQVIGRMHPVFLHFPIVLLLLYFFSLWSKDPGSRSSDLGLLAALTAVITSVMGLFLSLQQPYEGTAFFWHKWGGVSVAVLSFGCYYAHPFLAHKKMLARPFTIVAGALILFTGHFGANLTHGDNFLLEPLVKKEAVSLEEAIAFRDVVKPIFQSKCGRCHGESNNKGGLSLLDSVGVVSGGKTGPLYISGKPEESLLLRRILLPPDDKKHMAPKTDPQLTAEEIQLLRAWIRAGAPLNRKVIDLPPQDSFRLMAATTLLPSADFGAIAYSFAAAPEDRVRALNNNYRLVTPLNLNSPALSVQLFNRSAYRPEALKELLPIKEQITELSLARMPVKDEELKLVAQMENLQQLNLNFTDVTDNGLSLLGGLRNLKEVALSGTAVSAAGVERLMRLPSLSSLVVWNTKIDSAGAARLQQRFAAVTIETGYRDNGQTVLPLNPPLARTTPGIYEEPTPIELRHPFHGVEIRYTLDGKEPDSVNSPVYSTPLPLEPFTVVKAKAFKPGWYGSKTLKAVYFTRGIRPDSVVIESKDTKLKGKEKLLFDKELGDGNTSSGKWIGFRDPVTVYLFFRHPVTIRQVYLNLFVRTDWDIFPPSRIEVSGGRDRNNLKPLGSWKKAPPAGLEEPEMIQPAIAIKGGALQCIRLTLNPLPIPSWRPNKGKPSSTLISEVVFQ